MNVIQKITYFPTLKVTGIYYLLFFIVVTKFSDIGA